MQTRQALWRRLWLTLAGLGVAQAADAQTATPLAQLVPSEARALIVRVQGQFGEAASIGAGIVVGMDAARLYIATAGHVVFRDSVAARSVIVTLAPPWNDTLTGAVISPFADQPDVAVVAIAISASIPPEVLSSFDRLGSLHELGFGTPVVPVGCPASDCWKRAVTADRVVATDRRGIIYDTQRTIRGSSGGGLFNERWELVGLVVESEGGRGNAIDIDQVMAQLRAWSVPVQLRRPRIPREGFRIIAAVSLLQPLSGDEELRDDDRWPSGRVSLSRRARSRATWHASLTRLAPRDLAVTAGMVGVGWVFPLGRVSITPLAEVGLARVEGRFDADGVDVLQPDGSVRHEPRWEQVTADGISAAMGVDVQVALFRRLGLGITLARWSVSTPLEARGLPPVFAGAGVRWMR